MLAVQCSARQFDRGRDKLEPVRDYQYRLLVATLPVSCARARSGRRKAASGPDLLSLPQMAALVRGLTREQCAKLKPQQRHGW